MAAFDPFLPLVHPCYAGRRNMAERPITWNIRQYLIGFGIGLVCVLMGASYWIALLITAVSVLIVPGSKWLYRQLRGAN